MAHKHEYLVLSIVSTIITFIFFMWFIYFAYFTAKELLVHRVISNEEYAMYHSPWEVDDCNNSYSYKIDQYLDEADKLFSGEASLLTDEEKETNKQARSDAMKKCLNDVKSKASFQKGVNFQRNISKYGLATFFFLVLFLAFSLQSELIYRKWWKTKIKKTKK